MNPVEERYTGSFRERLQFLVKKIAYPLIVFLVSGFGFLAIRYRWDYGLVLFASTILCIAYFIVLEQIIPFRKDWKQTPREWGRDGMYFGLVILYGGLGEALVRAVAINLGPDTNGWPLWLNVLVALLAGSFVGYWQHRLEHRVDVFWPVHGIHHVPDKVNITNNSVVHFIELISGTILTQFVLLAIGISAEGLLISGLFTIMQGYFIHTNSDIRIGRWNHVLASCELHRFHHSNHVPEAGNFGAEIVLWDKLFGSYVYRPDQKQLVAGVAKPHTFPSPFNIVKGWWHPFRYWLRRLGHQPQYVYSEDRHIPVRDRLERVASGDSQ